MSIKSLGNPRSTYNAVWGQTARGAMPPPPPFEATGGTKTTYNGKTIHEFTSSGTWEVTAPSPGTVIEYVVIGGGASGGSCSGSYGNAGGGGAGAVIIGTETIGDGSPVFNSTNAVNVGGGGVAPGPGDYHGNDGAFSQIGVAGYSFSQAKSYSTYNGSSRGANYTVQYSDDNSSWHDAWTGVMSNNMPTPMGGPSADCGLKTGTGGEGDYGKHNYWRYVEGSATDNHHPRVSRILLTTPSGSAVDIVTYVPDNCADSGTYVIGTVNYTDSTYSAGPINSLGGGYGSMGDASPKTGGGAGGSGGGGAGGGGVGSNDLPGPSSGDPWPGTPGATSPTNGFGYDGGTGVDNGQGYCGAGGGGAGGVGQDGTFGQGGYGGVGIQLPSTFSPPTNPFGFVGSPTPYGSNNWVAGGGGGGINASGPQSPGDRGHGGGSPDVATPWSGGGNAGKDGTPANSASANSGAGGGGTGGDAAGVDAGSGGSGLVLIAY